MLPSMWRQTERGLRRKGPGQVIVMGSHMVVAVKEIPFCMLIRPQQGREWDRVFIFSPNTSSGLSHEVWPYSTYPPNNEFT